jgi:excisionase family DNA binding protein
MPERQTYSVDEAAKMIGVSRTSAWKAVQNGELPSIRIGHRCLVPRAALDRLLAGSKIPSEPVVQS